MDKYEGLDVQLDSMKIQRLIFSELFIVQNKIQAKFDKVFEEITSKQLIILAIVNAFPHPPSLTEVAKHAGCSRQNVKKVATVLQSNGYIRFLEEKGTRAVRIALEQKFYDFEEEFMKKSQEGLAVLFKGINYEQMRALYVGLHSLEENTDQFQEE